MTLLEKILNTESISEAHKLIRAHLLQEDLKSDKSNYARYKAAMKVISKKATSPEYLNYAWMDAEGYQYFTDTRSLFKLYHKIEKLPTKADIFTPRVEIVLKGPEDWLYHFTMNRDEIEKIRKLGNVYQYKGLIPDEEEEGTYLYRIYNNLYQTFYLKNALEILEADEVEIYIQRDQTNSYNNIKLITAAGQAIIASCKPMREKEIANNENL